MELTPGQRRLVFAVVVLALVGLGIYLVTGRGPGGTPAAAPSSSASSPQQTASGVPPTAVPSATPVSTAGGAEIYQWLPFTPADLSAAAQTTLTFATDYATWSSQESAAAYAAKFSGVVTPPEIATLKYDYGTSGVAGQRTADKQVSTGSGSIDSIRSFGTGPTSITFLVTITQKVSSTQPATTTTPQYAVTVVSSGGSWQVNDIELAQLGNQ
ncbi:MAG TPA: hypothetical protein VHF26_07165 [Trebonia sp.]|nr:hypothetical protein [Trebonia sp.]